MKRKFDELVSYFNKKVSEMEIETKYKMELLGMVTALGYAHEKEMSDLSETKRDSSDTISRQDAIDRTKKIPDLSVYAFCSFIDMLTHLPSAQPERKKGKWVYGEDEYGIDGYHCDKCGFFVPWDYAHKFINYIEDYNFCPNCGADMRGGNNG